MPIHVCIGCLKRFLVSKALLGLGITGRGRLKLLNYEFWECPRCDYEAVLKGKRRQASENAIGAGERSYEQAHNRYALIREEG